MTVRRPVRIDPRTAGRHAVWLLMVAAFSGPALAQTPAPGTLPPLPTPDAVQVVPATGSTVPPPFAQSVPSSGPTTPSPMTPPPAPETISLEPPIEALRPAAPPSPRLIDVVRRTDPAAGDVPPPPQPGLPEPLGTVPPTGSPGGFITAIGEAQDEIKVIVGRSKVFEASRPFSRILISDPTVADVQLLDADAPEPRLLNLFGQRFGSTTLTLWDSAGLVESFTVRVSIDTADLQSRIADLFPGADVTIRQVGAQVILEGQVPNSQIMYDVLRVVTADLRLAEGTGTTANPNPNASNAAGGNIMGSALGSNAAAALPGMGVIINRVRVPGPRQVLLKVKIAELNRTAMRQLGVSWLDTRNNAMLGSTIGGAGDILASSTNGQASAFSPLSLLPQAIGTPLANRILAPGFSPVASTFGATGTALTNANSQLFGIFNAGEFNIFINALRTNSLAKILAEPNLVSLDGQPARFQAGGSFPYPVPQAGAGGVGSVITIQYAQFGAILSFIPHILQGDVIRLDVEPNFSELNFAQGFAIPGTGGTVPGINQRNARTVVELREGQTLAIAGLLSTRTNATTSRIPGLGDLPIVGPWFSRNQIETLETELVVLVTPELVEAVDAADVPPGPGETLLEPNDWEFFFLGRIEGKTGNLHRATVDYMDPLDVMKHHQSEARWVIGPHGHAD